jgi:hypothetical protein
MRPYDSASARLDWILLMLQGPGCATVAGPDPLQVAADLPGAHDDPLLGEGSAELPAGPVPVLGEQPPQVLGYPVVMGEVRGGP